MNSHDTIGHEFIEVLLSIHTEVFIFHEKGPQITKQYLLYDQSCKNSIVVLFNWKLFFSVN